MTRKQEESEKEKKKEKKRRRVFTKRQLGPKRSGLEKILERKRNERVQRKKRKPDRNKERKEKKKRNKRKNRINGEREKKRKGELERRSGKQSSFSHFLPLLLDVRPTMLLLAGFVSIVVFSFCPSARLSVLVCLSRLSSIILRNIFNCLSD